MARKIKEERALMEDKIITSMEFGELKRLIAELGLSPTEVQDIFLRVISRYLRKEVFAEEKEKHLN